jgi:hypothetical protein
MAPSMQVEEAMLRRIQHACDGVRFAGRLVDMPPANLTTDAYVLECEQVAAALPSGARAP